MAKIFTTEFQKACKVCGASFIGTGPASKLCPLHKEERLQQIKDATRERIAASRAASGKIKNPGVGKGGNPLTGEANPSYVHGKYVFETLRHEIRQEVHSCERCSKDLINVPPRNWCVHHKDHNHWNHDRANLELLCRRCHAVEHEVHKHLPR